MSADLSNIILIFRNIELGGGLRKVLPIKLRETNAVEKKKQQGSSTKGLVMVRSSFCQPHVIVTYQKNHV